MRQTLERSPGRRRRRVGRPSRGGQARILRRQSMHQGKLRIDEAGHRSVPGELHGPSAEPAESNDHRRGHRPSSPSGASSRRRPRRADHATPLRPRHRGSLLSEPFVRRQDPRRPHVRRIAINHRSGIREIPRARRRRRRGLPRRLTPASNPEGSATGKPGSGARSGSNAYMPSCEKQRPRTRRRSPRSSSRAAARCRRDPSGTQSSAAGTTMIGDQLRSRRAAQGLYLRLPPEREPDSPVRERARRMLPISCEYGKRELEVDDAQVRRIGRSRIGRHSRSVVRGRATRIGRLLDGRCRGRGTDLGDDRRRPVRSRVVIVDQLEAGEEHAATERRQQGRHGEHAPAWPGRRLAQCSPQDLFGAGRGQRRDGRRCDHGVLPARSVAARRHSGHEARW